MKGLTRIIRSESWWNYKIPVFLAIGYSTALQSGFQVYVLAPWLLFLLAAIAAGAVYVSILNDSTDLQIDLACGKKNLFAGLPKYFRWLLPALALLVCLVFLVVILPDRLSAFLYLAAIVSFSLYSVSPFRFKSRGVAGVLCDACGAHLFPTLLIVSGSYWFMGRPVDWFWFFAVGAWALLFGLRGILWHQFIDRENDLVSGIRTYATRTQPELFVTKERIIMLLELIAFGFMLSRAMHPAIVIFLLLYGMLLAVKSKKLGIPVIFILAPKGKGIYFFMNEYYQIFLPLALLFIACVQHPLNLIVLLGHMVIFPANLLLLLNDSKLVLRKALKYLKVS